MTKKAKISRDFLVLSILTLITILTWIGMEIYRSLVKSEIPKVLEEQLKPLNPEIEVTVFDMLEKSNPSSPSAGLPAGRQGGQAETSD